MLYIELAIVIFLILVNGLLALAELAIVSSRRARLHLSIARLLAHAAHSHSQVIRAGFYRPSRSELP